MRCGEAEAGDASERWRRAIGVMTPWEPRLAAIVSCAFDTPYRPVTIRDAVPLDHRRPSPAWTVVHDPHHGPSPALDALARVDELVALLLDLDTELLSDPDDATRLREILAAVLADPAARRLLLDQLGPEGFATVVDRLARIVVAHLEDDHVVAAALGVLAQLSGGLAAGVRHGEAAEADYRSALLDGPDGDPHLLAMVLCNGGFPTPVVVTWAFALLGRAGERGARRPRLVRRGDRRAHGRAPAPGPHRQPLRRPGGAARPRPARPAPRLPPRRRPSWAVPRHGHRPLALPPLRHAADPHQGARLPRRPPRRHGQHGEPPRSP